MNCAVCKIYAIVSRVAKEMRTLNDKECLEKL